MQILPVSTRLLSKGNDLADVLWKSGVLQAGDIVVFSSKAVTMTERGARALPAAASADANALAAKTGQDPRFCEAILEETKRLNGRVIHACTGAVLTELRGSLLIANAGLDQSNAGEGMIIGWPEDPVKSVGQLQRDLSEKTGGAVGIVLSDSCSMPRRKGVIAVALTVAGFDPLVNQEGRTDLYGRALGMTTEAVADQLATAANAVMGNADQSIPAAVIRDHNIPFSAFIGWVPGIAKADDLFGHW